MQGRATHFYAANNSATHCTLISENRSDKNHSGEKTITAQWAKDTLHSDTENGSEKVLFQNNAVLLQRNDFDFDLHL